MAVCVQKRQRCRQLLRHETRHSGTPRLVLKAWKLPGESHIGMGMAEPESQPHTASVAETSTQVKADSRLCPRDEFQVEPIGRRAGTLSGNSFNMCLPGGDGAAKCERAVVK